MDIAQITALAGIALWDLRTRYIPVWMVLLVALLLAPDLHSHAWISAGIALIVLWWWRAGPADWIVIPILAGIYGVAWTIGASCILGLWWHKRKQMVPLLFTSSVMPITCFIYSVWEVLYS